MLNTHSGAGWVRTGLPLYILGYLIVYVLFLRKKKGKDFILWTLFYWSVMLIIDLTQFPLPLGQQARTHIMEKHQFRLNLRPLQNIYYNLIQSFNPRHLVENAANVIVFIPFGFFVYALKQNRKHPLLETVMLGFGVSLLIELIQLVTSYYSLNVRIFDVDDLIMNTAGTWIGAIFMLLFLKIVQKKKG